MHVIYLSPLTGLYTCFYKKTHFDEYMAHEIVFTAVLKHTWLHLIRTLTGYSKFNMFIRIFILGLTGWVFFNAKYFLQNYLSISLVSPSVNSIIFRFIFSFYTAHIILLEVIQPFPSFRFKPYLILNIRKQTLAMCYTIIHASSVFMIGSIMSGVTILNLLLGGSNKLVVLQFTFVFLTGLLGWTFLYSAFIVRTKNSILHKIIRTAAVMIGGFYAFSDYNLILVSVYKSGIPRSYALSHLAFFNIALFISSLYIYRKLIQRNFYIDDTK